MESARRYRLLESIQNEQDRVAFLTGLSEFFLGLLNDLPLPEAENETDISFIYTELKRVETFLIKRDLVFIKDLREAIASIQAVAILLKRPFSLEIFKETSRQYQYFSALLASLYQDCVSSLAKR